MLVISVKLKPSMLSVWVAASFTYSVVAKNVLIETSPKLNLVLFSPMNLPNVLS